MTWLLYLPLTTIVCLLAFPLAPIIALFADGQGDVTLSAKNPLRLWLTPDNPIEGDSGHFERWAGFVERDRQRPVSSGRLVCNNVPKSDQCAMDAIRDMANVFRPLPARLSGMEIAECVQVPYPACRQSGICRT